MGFLLQSGDLLPKVSGDKKKIKKIKRSDTKSMSSLCEPIFDKQIKTQTQLSQSRH